MLRSPTCPPPPTRVPIPIKPLFSAAVFLELDCHRFFSGHSDVRVDAKLNKFLFSKGVRNVPTRVRVRLSRKRNEDEEATEKVRACRCVPCVLLVTCACFDKTVCGFAPSHWCIASTCWVYRRGWVFPRGCRVMGGCGVAPRHCCRYTLQEHSCLNPPPPLPFI